MSSQSELVEAIIGLNNMGDDWDAQHIGELIADWHKKIELQARLDPFDFVEPCEPDCDDVRHAYHQGQWDMATRIEAQQDELEDS